MLITRYTTPLRDDPIDPEADYTVELASVEDTLELRIWADAVEDRPVEPGLRVVDCTFRTGAVAFVFQAGPTAEPEGVVHTLPHVWSQNSMPRS